MFRLSMARKEATVVAKCEVEALSAFIAEHMQGHSEADILALGIVGITTTKVRRPGGDSYLVVQVQCRRQWDDEAYFFTLRSAGRRVWVESSSLDAS